MPSQVSLLGKFIKSDACQSSSHLFTAVKICLGIRKITLKCQLCGNNTRNYNDPIIININYTILEGLLRGEKLRHTYNWCAITTQSPLV